MDIQDVFANAIHVIPNLQRYKDVIIGTQRVIKTINGRHRGLRDTKKIITVVDSFTIVLTFTDSAGTYYINADNSENFETLGLSVGDKIWFSGEGALNTGQHTIEAITDNAGTKDRLTVTEVVVADAGRSGVLAGFTLLSGCSYNHLTGVIELPNTVKETIEVFTDGDELKVVDYDDLNNGVYAHSYSPIARRKFVISSDIYGTDIEILAWFDLENISSVNASTHATIIDVPVDYEEIIQDGVIYYLTSMPQYKNELLNKESKESFFIGIQLLSDEQAVAFHTPRREARKYY